MASSSVMASSCSDEAAYESDASSLLSSPPSRLSSPPAGLPKLENQYPTPPPSQDCSQTGSPSPDDSSAMNSDKDGPPPRKRRRISERVPTPRTTEYLDLRNGRVDPDEQAQLDRLLNVLHKRQKIVVIAGAGISVSAGIPDFRSSTGLFTSLRSQHNLKGSGKDLFDASVVYKDASSTSSFHEMVRSMSKLTKAAKPTPFHHMLATLSQQDRLLRLYSQNVDGIDTSLEPLTTKIPLQKDKETGKWPRTVQLHGGLDKMVCSKCHELKPFEPDLFEGPVPPVCSNCEDLDRTRTEVMGRRSHGVGMLRPRMVLYNEHNPDDEAIGSVTRDDLRKRPDAVIVVGTTLKVPGVKRIVREMCATVRDRKDGVAIWINNDPEPSGKEFEDCWDIIVRGKCDDIARLAALGEWDHQEEPREVTIQSVERASKADPRVEIGRPNTTFKAPSESLSPCSSPERPSDDEMEVLTPLTSRTASIIPDSFDSDVPAETPSRRKSKTPVKPATKRAPAKSIANSTSINNMFAAAKATTTAATAAKPEPAKKSSVKYVKKPASATTKAAAAKKAPPKKAPAAKAAQPKSKQAAITNQFKQTKSASTTAAGKATKEKALSKDMDPNRPLDPISPEDLRNNINVSSSFSIGIKSTISDSEEERIRRTIVS